MPMEQLLVLSLHSSKHKGAILPPFPLWGDIIMKNKSDNKRETKENRMPVFIKVCCYIITFISFFIFFYGLSVHFSQQKDIISTNYIVEILDE